MFTTLLLFFSSLFVGVCFLSLGFWCCWIAGFRYSCPEQTKLLDNEPILEVVERIVTVEVPVPVIREVEVVKVEKVIERVEVPVEKRVVVTEVVEKRVEVPVVSGFSEIPTDQSVFICDVEYMPANPMCVQGLVIRTASEPSVLVAQLYLRPLALPVPNVHPDMEILNKRMAELFRNPVVFVFWDGRNDIAAFKFPTTIRKLEFAHWSTWGGAYGQYQALGNWAANIGMGFHRSRNAQYETHITWYLMVYLAKHRGCTVADLIMSLPEGVHLSLTPTGLVIFRVMPYTVAPGLSSRLATLLMARFWRISTISEAVNTIVALNLDTVEGCRDALASIRTVQSVPGRSLVDLGQPGVRFPDGWDDYFVHSSMADFFRIWNQLHRALEYRDTNVAKDTQVGRVANNAPAAGPSNERTSQSMQDNRKTIAETLNEIEMFIADATRIWGRDKFEREVGLTWTAQAAQQAGQQQAAGGNP